MFGCRSLEIFRKKPDFFLQKSKILVKKFGKSLEIWVRKKVWILTKIVRQFWKNYVKFVFLSQKNLFLGQKVQKNFRIILEKFRNRVFWTFGNVGNFGNFGNCSIPKFPKITKNDVKLELQKSQKTHSDLKTDSKVQLKVLNAGPYSILTGKSIIFIPAKPNLHFYKPLTL